MILNRKGEQFFYEGTTYTIGGKIIVNNASAYEGLYGTIREIRDGTDKKTLTSSPEILCELFPPLLPEEAEHLQEALSRQRGDAVTLETHDFTRVLLSPNMVRLIGTNTWDTMISVYTLTDDWTVDYDGGLEVYAYLDYDEAKFAMRSMVYESSLHGCIHHWKDKDDFREDGCEGYYECWLEGSHIENHYTLSIEEHRINLPVSLFQQIGQQYLNQRRREDFASQISQWDEISSLTDEEYQQLISNPDIPAMIESGLSKNDSYWEAYWETVSEAAHTLVRKFLAQRDLERVGEGK